MTTLRSAHRSAWLVPAGLVLLSLVPAIAGTSRLVELAGNTEITAANARFVAMPIPTVLHMLSVVPFGLLGAFQFSGALRRRNRGWHRKAGSALVVLGLMAALSGLWMTLVFPWANNDGEAVYSMRLIVGLFMTVSIVAGIDAIRRRDFVAPGQWMIRAYAIGAGAGTQVFTHLPWFVLVDMQPPEGPRAVMMGAAWVINAVVAEWVIRSAGRERPMAHAAMGPRALLGTAGEIQHAN
jgi:uncharacterized membrane protein